MAMFPASSLWPGRERAPLGRLALSMTAAASTVALTLSVVAFLVAGMTEPTVEAVLTVTTGAAITLTALVAAFAATFGVAGVAALWRLARRGLLAWAVAGLISGGLAGALFGAVAMPVFRPAVVLAFALVGWGFFLLIRLFAGVRSAPRARRAGSAPVGGVAAPNG